MKEYTSWERTYEKQTEEIKGGRARERERERERLRGEERKSQEAFDKKKESDVQAV